MATPEPVRVFIGYDAKEAVGYHACCQSIIEHTTMPVEIHPVALSLMERFYTERHVDGSNAFIYTRFLVPYLCGWSGFAIWLDGDMLVRGDLGELWNMRRADRGVQVVKHDYKTAHPVKYLGAKNEDYPRKNWSSVVVWSCGFFPNRVLTPEYVTRAPGSHLHRFGWLKDEQIDDLPETWNHLTMESAPNPQAKLLHHTVGLPCFPGYEAQEGAGEWFGTVARMNAPMGA